MRLLVLPALVMLTGCGLISPEYDRCDKPPPYAGSQEAPPLVTPEGVDAPDTRNALKIPEPSAPEKPRDGRCVDIPPSFLPNRTPEKG